jgi:hypothetical protein
MVKKSIFVVGIAALVGMGSATANPGTIGGMIVGREWGNAKRLLNGELRVSDATMNAFIKEHAKAGKQEFNRIFLNDVIRLNNDGLTHARRKSCLQKKLVGAEKPSHKDYRFETIRDHLKSPNKGSLWPFLIHYSLERLESMKRENEWILSRYGYLVERDNGGVQLAPADLAKREQEALKKYPTKAAAYKARFDGKWCLQKQFGKGDLQASIALLAHGKQDHARRKWLLEALVKDNEKPAVDVKNKE